MDSYWVALAGIEHCQPGSNSQRSLDLGQPSAGIKGTCDHAQTVIWLSVATPYLLYVSIDEVLLSVQVTRNGRFCESVSRF